MSFDTIDNYFHFIFWPHVLAYILYIQVKYLLLLFEGANSKLNRPKYKALESDEDFGYSSLFCFLTCFCCCCCCCDCCCCVSKLSETLLEYNLKFDRWLIKLLLGNKGGVIERHQDAFQPDEDSSDKIFAPIYIRRKPLNSFEVNIVSTLIFTFGLLIGITSFDIFFLAVSNTCTDDRRFSCFVLPEYVDEDMDELNITRNRLSNCSYWENSNISDQVFVVCYKWVYNTRGVITAVGGLLTLFQVTITATMSIYISLAEYLHSHHECLKLLKKLFCVISESDDQICETLASIRHRIACVFIIIEFVLFVVIWGIIIGFSGISSSNSIEGYLSEHGSQGLLIFGIITTCILLPIEQYTQYETQKPKKTYTKEEQEEAWERLIESFMKDSDDQYFI